MLTTLRARAALKTIVLVTMVAGVFAPWSYSFYRCQMMGTISSPCCGEHEDESHQHANAQLRAQRCCTKVTVAVARVPGETNFQKYSQNYWMTLPTLAGGIESAYVEPKSSSGLISWTRVQFDSGPPIILQTKSLLI